VAVLANTNVDFGSVGQGNVDHGMSAQGTKSAAVSLASHGVQPQRVDRFGREAIAQQLDGDRATAADIACPENSARSAYFL
jgi:hypothetical protein